MAARFLFGVEGPDFGSVEDGAASVAGFFRFLEALAFFVVCSGTAFSLASRDAALILADFLDDILSVLVESCERR